MSIGSLDQKLAWTALINRVHKTWNHPSMRGMRLTFDEVQMLAMAHEPEVNMDAEDWEELDRRNRQ